MLGKLRRDFKRLRFLAKIKSEEFPSHVKGKIIFIGHKHMSGVVVFTVLTRFHRKKKFAMDFRMAENMFEDMELHPIDIYGEKIEYRDAQIYFENEALNPIFE